MIPIQIRRLFWRYFSALIDCLFLRSISRKVETLRVVSGFIEMVSQEAGTEIAKTLPKASLTNSIVKNSTSAPLITEISRKIGVISSALLKVLQWLSQLRTPRSKLIFSQQKKGRKKLLLQPKRRNTHLCRTHPPSQGGDQRPAADAGQQSRANGRQLKSRWPTSKRISGAPSTKETKCLSLKLTFD